MSGFPTGDLHPIYIAPMLGTHKPCHPTGISPPVTTHRMSQPRPRMHIDVLQKMKCITEGQIADWLHQRSIPKDPYHGDSSPAFYLQFYAPTNHRRIDAFVRHYYDRIVPEADSLIHITDWGLYQQSEMIAIVGIRSSRGEDRILIDAPGHILPSGEKEIGISIFSLSASFAWSSYLYSPRDHSTLFNCHNCISDFIISVWLEYI